MLDITFHQSPYDEKEAVCLSCDLARALNVSVGRIYQHLNHNTCVKHTIGGGIWQYLIPQDEVIRLARITNPERMVEAFDTVLALHRSPWYRRLIRGQIGYKDKAFWRVGEEVEMQLNPGARFPVPQTTCQMHVDPNMQGDVPAQSATPPKPSQAPIQSDEPPWKSHPAVQAVEKVAKLQTQEEAASTLCAGVPDDVVWKQYETFIHRKLMNEGFSSYSAQRIIDTRAPTAVRLLKDLLRESVRFPDFLRDNEQTAESSDIEKEQVFNMREAAGEAGMGSGKFVEQLLQDRVLYREHGRGSLRAYQHHIDLGRLVMVRKAYVTEGGDARITFVARFTKKGLEWIRNKYQNQK